MAAAAPTLTPVTLELGGKSPVLVTESADIDVAARRIAWIKLLNSGQTCIAPDYVLADRKIVAELTDKIVATIAEFRATEPDPSLRIVNERQFDRLVSLISATDGKVVAGGGSDRSTLRIEPTVILEPGPDDPVMTDEIFGPILPIITVESPEAAVRFVNARPKPLALYVFTSSQQQGRELIDRMPSGGAVINHIAMHCLAPQLPFGGVGASGMGAYHGKWGVRGPQPPAGRAGEAEQAGPEPDVPALHRPGYQDHAQADVGRGGLAANSPKSPCVVLNGQQRVGDSPERILMPNFERRIDTGDVSNPPVRRKSVRRKPTRVPRAICAYVKYQPQQGVTEAAMRSAGIKKV